MNYLVLIIVALAGIALGIFIARRNKGGLIPEQEARKAENKKKILEFIQANGKIQNNDIVSLQTLPSVKVFNRDFMAENIFTSTGEESQKTLP